MRVLSAVVGDGSWLGENGIASSGHYLSFVCFFLSHPPLSVGCFILCCAVGMGWLAAAGDECFVERGPDVCVVVALGCYSTAMAGDCVTGGGEAFTRGRKYFARTSFVAPEGSSIRYCKGVRARK